MSDDDLDIERLLRSTLSERARQLPPGTQLAEQIIAEADHPRAVREVRGPRRWRGWTLPAVAAGSVAAVVAIVIGLAQVHQSHKNAADHRSPATTHPQATSGSTARFSGNSTSNGSGSGESSGSAAPSASTVEPTSTPAAGQAGGPVGPVGPHFQAVDLTFAGDQDGWALGTSGCLNGTPGRCPTILHTADGGTEWGSIQIPTPLIAPGCGSECVTNLRFANADVGYAFGPDALYMTTDGGATWGTNQGDTKYLEVADGTALRVAGGELQIAEVGSEQWQAAAVPPTAQSVKQLVRSSHDAYALSVSKTAASTGAAQSVIASTDDGKTWADRGDPCQPEPALSPGQLVAGADGSLTVVCQDSPVSKTVTPTRSVVTSTDGGKTFSDPVALPATAQDVRFAAASSSVLFYVDKQLHRSTDSGRSWAIVSPDPVATSQSSPIVFLGFETPDTGRLVTGGSSTIWMTTDSGADWNSHVFK